MRVEKLRCLSCVDCDVVVRVGAVRGREFCPKPIATEHAGFLLLDLTTHLSFSSIVSEQTSIRVRAAPLVAQYE